MVHFSHLGQFGSMIIIFEKKIHQSIYMFMGFPRDYGSNPFLTAP